MKHLLTAYLAATLMIGSAALLVLFLANRKLRSRALSYFMAICACLEVSVLHNLLLFYMGINVSDRLSPGLLIFLFSSLPFGYLMQALIPIFTNRLYNLPWERAANRVIWIITGLQGILTLTPFFARYDAQSGILSLGPAYYSNSVLLLCAQLYLLSNAIFNHKRLPPGIRRLVLLGLGVLLVSLPGLVHDITYFQGRPQIGVVPVTFIYFPVFFLIISVCCIIFGLRFLMRVGGDSLSAGLVSPESPASALAQRLAALGASQGLSERELEVAAQVIEGLGNKQIASRLGVSPKTVNNHIYNLYRKLKINSRFELMALCGYAGRG